MTQKERNEMSSIYDLKLHQSIRFLKEHTIEIFRVPGGWIYKFHYRLMDDTTSIRINSVFVPFNNEFQELKAMPAEAQETTKETEALLKICIEALYQLRQPKGVYSMNKLEHANNTIAASIGIAEMTLKKIGEF